MEPKQKLGVAIILGATIAYALTRTKKHKLEQRAIEEKQTAKEYKTEGYIKQATEEKQHSTFFKKEATKEKGKWFEKMKAIKEAKKLIRMSTKEINKGFNWVFK